MSDRETITIRAGIFPSANPDGVSVMVTIPTGCPEVSDGFFRILPQLVKDQCSRFDSMPWPFTQREISPAFSAMPEIPMPTTGGLEHGFDSFVKASLTDIVRRFADCWLSGCALEWGSIVEISKDASTRNDLDKLVTGFLRSGFSQFSDFLCLFRYLFLQGECDRMGRDELALYIRNSIGNFLGRVGREELVQYLQGCGYATNGADDGCGNSHVSSCVGSGCKGESFNPTTQGGTPMEANS